MPVTSAKNQPLSPLAADLGLQGQTPGDDALNEEERKKRLQRAMANNPVMAMQSMLGAGSVLDLGIR
jgi:hypothetical protein